MKAKHFSQRATCDAGTGCSTTHTHTTDANVEDSMEYALRRSHVPHASVAAWRTVGRCSSTAAHLHPSPTLCMDFIGGQRGWKAGANMGRSGTYHRAETRWGQSAASLVRPSPPSHTPAVPLNSLAATATAQRREVREGLGLAGGYFACACAASAFGTGREPEGACGAPSAPIQHSGGANESLIGF